MNVDISPLATFSCCPPLDRAGLTQDEAMTTAAVFEALSDPARVSIVNPLAPAEILRLEGVPT